MKKIILGIIIGVGFTAMVGAGVEGYVVNKKTADVIVIENIKVFHDCTPVMEYEYLGTIKMAVSWSGMYSEIRAYLIKTAKKKYPNADAIIINGLGNADVIKFK